MQDYLEERARKVREFFGLAPEAVLVPDQSIIADIPAPVAGQMERFNIEWHIIPDADAVPFDESYARLMYPSCASDSGSVKAHAARCREALIAGHRRHQGRILGIEATRKPVYLPGNRQFYGTAYGFDTAADPFAEYLGSTAFSTSTRYGHNYASLREFLDLVNRDWRMRDLMPKGYRLSICPPAVFNLIGNIFHREWSETETLELGFYRDDHGNAKCYAVGSNGPGDFSYIHEVEGSSDWTLLGFRTALVPE